jgi:hypothetical protein
MRAIVYFPLRSSELRKEAAGIMMQSRPTFKCPNPGCGAEHFAVASDEPPVAKPECLECGASFVEKDDGAFLHYFSTRHIFD